ncbi:MAG: peptidoglycan DD-metalloendopeptidase family protein [Armatimonadetes bacterium]|nr:peptidoglycan DD-metalloendopeptidase family protein [Armatimonadota bacterium]
MKRFSLAVVLLMMLSLIPLSAQQSSAKKKQDTLSKTLKKVKQKRESIRAELREKTEETEEMMDEIHSVDRKLEKLEAKLEDTESELKKSKSAQAKLGEELAEKTAELDEVKGKVSRRLRAIYVSGESAPISILISSKSVTDLASRKALLERIAEKDRGLFNDVRVIRDAVLAKKKEQDRVVVTIAELGERQKAEMAELANVRAEKKKIFSVLKAQEDALEDQLEEMLRESSRLEAQIAEIQARTSGSVAIFRGRFIQPVSGRMSSGFGYRTHPISGRRKMHTGVDWAAPTGTPIRAAGSGRVITAAYLRGYGNTIVIDHGGGISTLYGHCSRLYARVGQDVKQGERIAAVGSTGYSTGPHLHFEVRVNGKPVNPVGRL